MFTFFKSKTENSINVKCDENTGVFDRSLDELTEDDIAPAKPIDKATRTYNTVRIFLIIICLSVFAYCCYLFIYNMIEYKRADDIYISLSDEFFDVERDKGYVISDGVTKMKLLSPSVAIPIFSEALKLDNSEISKFYSEDSSSYNMEFERMKSKLEDLRAQNSDIVGFMYVNGTKISYPVTQYKDNNYYLDHSFDRKTLKSGTIFMDFRNKKDLSENKNIVIYGHNMTNGSMLGGVPKFYKSESFFNDTPIILYAFDGIYTFEVFSIYRTTADYQYFRTAFDSDEDFLSFANEMKSNSVYTKDVELDKDDIILTLSTCTNTHQMGRYALHAKLTRIDN
ncbi:MAG: class B sortase [Ruminococcaceae bacterium]|nr:class B sortase [Oscillospiraceae bacterium]